MGTGQYYGISDSSEGGPDFLYGKADAEKNLVKKVKVERVTQPPQQAQQNDTMRAVEIDEARAGKVICNFFIQYFDAGCGNSDN
jgi:hypothetical protein